MRCRSSSARPPTSTTSSTGSTRSCSRAAATSIPSTTGRSSIPRRTRSIAAATSSSSLSCARARERAMPVLGICRGIQLVNVAYGGTLVQHLPDLAAVDHEQLDAWDALAHRIEIAPDSRLARVMDTTAMEVNSVHHQAVDRLGAGLRAVAWADDGVVEAIEHETDPVLAVQWHPRVDGQRRLGAPATALRSARRPALTDRQRLRRAVGRLPARSRLQPASGFTKAVPCLLGRDTETARLSARLDDVRAGRGAVLAWRARPGLARPPCSRWAAAKAADMRVLRATGVESGSSWPSRVLPSSACRCSSTSTRSPRPSDTLCGRHSRSRMELPGDRSSSRWRRCRFCRRPRERVPCSSRGRRTVARPRLGGRARVRDQATARRADRDLRRGANRRARTPGCRGARGCGSVRGGCSRIARRRGRDPPGGRS